MHALTGARRYAEDFRQKMPAPSMSTISSLDAVGPPVVDDRILATVDHPVVVNDAVAANCQLRIQRLQSLNRRLVQIAVEPHHCEILNGRIFQGVSKPSDDELDLIVQKAVSLEVMAHEVNSNRQDLPIAEIQITVGREMVRIGNGQALE